MALAEFSSPLLSKSSNLCVLLLPSQKWPWSLTGMYLFLRFRKLFLLWLKLTDRLKSSCKAIWQRNKNRQTDSNGMTLISLGNQAKNENVTSDPLLRASPLKARMRKIYPGSEKTCGNYCVLVTKLESRKGTNCEWLLSPPKSPLLLKFLITILLYLLFKEKKWGHGTVTTREGYLGDRMQRILLPKGQTEAGGAVPHWAETMQLPKIT